MLKTHTHTDIDAIVKKKLNGDNFKIKYVG